MKFLVTTVLLSLALLAQGQVTEISQNMSQGAKPGLSIILTGTDSKTVEAAWTKYMKDFKGKSKKDKKSEEIFTDDSTIENMSSNTVDVYAKAMTEGTDVRLNVWFDLGGAYVNQAAQPDAYAVSVGMLNEFSSMVSISAVEDQIKEEENVLEKMEGEMKGLVKDKEGLESEIAKCEKKIEEAKAKIEENKAAQAAQQKTIDEQVSKVKMTKDKLKKIN